MLRKILPHAAIIIAAMYVVFFAIDRVNSAMGFINNNITKVLLLVFSVVSVFNALWLIHDDRQATRRRIQRERERQARLRAQRQSGTAAPSAPPTAGRRSPSSGSARTTRYVR